MSGLSQSISRCVAGVALRARGIALVSLRPSLLVALTLFALGTLFVVADAPSTGSPQVSASVLAPGAPGPEAIEAAVACATPGPEATIAYDDGLYNFGLVAAPLTTIAANRFCVASPANIVSARLYLVGPILRPIRVHVLDAGFRSTFSLDIQPQFENWLEVDLSSANISVDGDFYIGLQWLELFDGTFPRPYLGVDTTTPHHDMSYLGTLGSRQASPRAGEDFMIRVSVIAEGSVPTPTPTAQPDSDGDGVPDSSDNCPAWPNADQSLPPWPVPADDPDCDGWSTSDETLIGTDPNLACSTNNWPPDFNDDRNVDIFDVNALRPPMFLSQPGNPDYSARLDINPDGSIDIFDVNALRPPIFSSTCTP